MAYPIPATRVSDAMGGLFYLILSSNWALRIVHMGWFPFQRWVVCKGGGGIPTTVNMGKNSCFSCGRDAKAEAGRPPTKKLWISSHIWASSPALTHRWNGIHLIYGTSPMCTEGWHRFAWMHKLAATLPLPPHRTLKIISAVTEMDYQPCYAKIWWIISISSSLICA